VSWLRPVPLLRGKRIEELLDLVGLCDRANDKVQSYSMGMKQRLGIAGGAAQRPEAAAAGRACQRLDPAGIGGHARHPEGRSRLKARRSSCSSHLLAEIQVMADVWSGSSPPGSWSARVR